MKNAVVITEDMNPKHKRGKGHKGHKKGVMPAGLKKFWASHKRGGHKAGHKASHKRGHKAATHTTYKVPAGHAIVNVSQLRHNVVPIGHQTRPVYTRTGPHTITRSRDRRALPYTVNPFDFGKMNLSWHNAIGAGLVAIVGAVSIDVITNYLPDTIKKPNAFRIGAKAIIGGGLGFLLSMKSKPAAVIFLLGVGINIVKDIWDTFEISKLLPKLPAKTSTASAAAAAAAAAAAPAETSTMTVGEQQVSNITSKANQFHEQATGTISLGDGTYSGQFAVLSMIN